MLTPGNFVKYCFIYPFAAATLTTILYGEKVLHYMTYYYACTDDMILISFQVPMIQTSENY